MKHSYDVKEANFNGLVVVRSVEMPVLLDIGTEWCITSSPSIVVR
jgi:thioredoxin-like negative regulator of GroEL